MKLYRILDTWSGKYFSYQWGYGWENAKFNDSGAFFKKPDTIRKHLRHLTTMYEWKPSNVGTINVISWFPVYQCPQRLKRFKVQVSNVNIIGEEILGSENFLLQKDLIKQEQEK